MKKLLLFIVGLSMSAFCTGQVVNLNVARNWSYLKWYSYDEISGEKFRGYKETLSGNFISAEMEVFNRKYFGLSAEAGFMQQKGENQYLGMTGYNSWGIIHAKTKLSYLLFNAAFIIKYPVHDKLVPYISLGPGLNYLVAHKNESDRMLNMETLVPGIFCKGGVKYNWSRFVFGVNAAYHLNFKKISTHPSYPGSSGFVPEEHTYAKTLIAGISVGYRPF